MEKRKIAWMLLSAITISDYDREQLEEGIPAATETELRQLVEDLTS